MLNPSKMSYFIKNLGGLISLSCLLLSIKVISSGLGSAPTSSRSNSNTLKPLTLTNMSSLSTPRPYPMHQKKGLADLLKREVSFIQVYSKVW